MTKLVELTSTPSDRLVPLPNRLRLAVAGYLARFKGSSREHTKSDSRCCLTWRAERGLDPLASGRVGAVAGARNPAPASDQDRQ
jgi:integrase/recombinase XerD